MSTIHKNEAHIAGVLARDTEVRHTSTGKSVANLSVATTYEKSTEFHRIVCWDKLAEKVGPLRKGTFIQVVGRLQTRSWDDKQTNQKRYMTEVVAWQVVIPDKDTVVTNAHGVEVSDADIPF